MVKIQITVEKTSRLTREFCITEEELANINESTPHLNEMYNMIDEEADEADYDYRVVDLTHDEEIVIDFD